MQKFWILIGLLLFGYTFVSCSATSPPLQPGETAVPFEEVARNEEGIGFEGREPKLLIATNLDELLLIKALVNPVDVAAIEQVDLSKYVVIALFRNLQGGTNHPVTIESIRKHENTFIVRAQFWEPATGYASQAVITYPYHLVKVDKTLLPKEGMKLELESYHSQFVPR